MMRMAVVLSAVFAQQTQDRTFLDFQRDTVVGMDRPK